MVRCLQRRLRAVARRADRAAEVVGRTLALARGRDTCMGLYGPHITRTGHVSRIPLPYWRTAGRHCERKPRLLRSLDPSHCNACVLL
jgi:hypothetical protein